MIVFQEGLLFLALVWSRIGEPAEAFIGEETV